MGAARRYSRRGAERVPAEARNTEPGSRCRPAEPAFQQRVTGTVHNGVSQQGIDVVDLSMRLSGSPSGVVRIRLGGRALADGGLTMDSSAVTLGPPTDPVDIRAASKLCEVPCWTHWWGLAMVTRFACGFCSISGKGRCAARSTELP